MSYFIAEEYRRLHNASVQAKHELGELVAAQALQEFKFKPVELARYQVVIAGVQDRLNNLLERKPSLMKDKRLPR